MGLVDHAVYDIRCNADSGIGLKAKVLDHNVLLACQMAHKRCRVCARVQCAADGDPGSVQIVGSVLDQVVHVIIVVLGLVLGNRDCKQPQVCHTVNDIGVLFRTPSIAVKVACAAVIVRPEPACCGKRSRLRVEHQKLQELVSGLKRHMAYPVIDHVITVGEKPCLFIDHGSAVIGEPLPELIGIILQRIGSLLLLRRVIGCFLIDLIPAAYLVFCRRLQPCEELSGTKLRIFRHIGQGVGAEEELIHKGHGILITGICHPGQDGIHIIKPFPVLHLSRVLIDPGPECVCTEREDILFIILSLGVRAGRFVSA